MWNGCVRSTRGDRTAEAATSTPVARPVHPQGDRRAGSETGKQETQRWRAAVDALCYGLVAAVVGGGRRCRCRRRRLLFARHRGGGEDLVAVAAHRFTGPRGLSRV